MSNAETILREYVCSTALAEEEAADTRVRLREADASICRLKRAYATALRARYNFDAAFTHPNGLMSDQDLAEDEAHVVEMELYAERDRRAFRSCYGCDPFNVINDPEGWRDR